MSYSGLCEVEVSNFDPNFSRVFFARFKLSFV